MGNEDLKKYLQLANDYKDRVQIVLVCNVAGLTIDEEDYHEDSIISEYMTLQQYNKILHSLRQENFDVVAYFDENEFINDVINGICKNTEQKKLLVLNSAQKGTKVGRKSLIPAFCDLHNIYHNNSNAYIVSLCRDKYNSGCLLENWGFSVPKSWLYQYSVGWHLNKRPPEGIRVITKLNYETSSIGLNESNIFQYDSTKDSLIEKMCQIYKQDIIVQEFIYGYEVETSFIRTYDSFAFSPIGIRMKENDMLGDQILDYDIRKNHTYSFFELSYNFPQLAYEIQRNTIMVGESLNITGLGRIDYRITPQHQFYITDVATNPGYSEASTTYYIFKQSGYSYSDMLKILIGVTLTKYLS